MFRPGWLLTGFVGVFLPLFVALGWWQLNRADQKAQLMTQIEAGRAQVLPLNKETEPVPYQRYALTGALNPKRVWLLDNRTYQGRVGYEVWAPLVSEKHWYLVSLGWVAGTGDRQRLPELNLPEGERRWMGEWRPPSDSIVLSDLSSGDEWPRVIQRIDPETMAQQIQRETPRGLLQLEEAQPGVGPVIWTPTVMTAERHRGYAFQWFAMALALVMMYGYAGWQRNKTTHPDSNENK